MLDDLHIRSMDEPELKGKSAERWAKFQQRHGFPHKAYPGSKPFDWLTKNLPKQSLEQPERPQTSTQPHTTQMRRESSHGQAQWKGTKRDIKPVVEAAVPRKKPRKR